MNYITKIIIKYYLTNFILKYRGAKFSIIILH